MLSDKDLKMLLLSKPSIVAPFPPQFNRPLTDASWDNYESPIQASSIDLFAGYIYIPGKKRGKKGSHKHGAESYSIPQGQSVIVTTYQRLELPNDMGGIVFPPSGDLSSKGILVSNLGHIDPGYKGRLRFTLINMGSEEFIIHRGSTRVGTLMLFNTSSMVQSDWHSRAVAANKVDRSKSEPNQEEIDALAPYFAGMDSRMETIANKIVTPIRYLNAQIVWPIIATLAVLVSVTYFSFGDDYFAQKKKLLELEHQLQMLELKIINEADKNPSKPKLPVPTP